MNFLEAVSNMSRLRHTNIVTLNGYCFYEFIEMEVYTTCSILLMKVQDTDLECTCTRTLGTAEL
ncbi:hypothetical protein SDJN02_06466, partial [Cucurbita argyrosperma subsp. argyrosperma]